MSGGQQYASTDAEPDLVARIGAGDRAAEAEFVRRYATGVRVLMRRHCRPGDPIVEDLSQDVLMQVLARLRAGALRDANALPAYVRAAVVHTAGANYRGRPDASPVVEMDQLEGAENPVAAHASTQLATLLKTLLSQMPVARDREVLTRFYLREQERDDVCRDLGIDIPHFRRVLHRARERFRALLDQAGLSEV